MSCLVAFCVAYAALCIWAVLEWSRAPVWDEWTEAERKLVKNLEERPMPPMDLTLPNPEPGPYRLLLYEEAGRWREYFHSAKLWEVEFQAGRPDDGMPWKIVRDGRLVRQCHGAAEVIEA